MSDLVALVGWFTCFLFGRTMKTRREESIVARRFSGFVDLRMYQNMFLGMTTFVTVFFFSSSKGMWFWRSERCFGLVHHLVLNLNNGGGKNWTSVWVTGSCSRDRSMRKYEMKKMIIALCAPYYGDASRWSPRWDAKGANEAATRNDPRP